jgi:hypothetical protein
MFSRQDLETTLPIALVIGTFMQLACGPSISPALTDFDRCTRGPIVSIEHGESRVEVECEIKDGIHLIAVPGRQVSVDELLAIGLSKTLADMFSGAHDAAQWCVAQEFARDPNPPPDVTKIPVANSECVSSELQIDTPYQTRASRVRLVIDRAAAGNAKLSQFAPVD